MQHVTPQARQVNFGRTPTKALLIIGAAATILGLLICIAFVVAAGVDYRLTEDLGIDPGPTPPAIVAGMTAGFWIFVVGIVTLAAAGFLRILRR
ncbi:hypothetical protein [Micrococcoides hystricis]|uniref:Uncharacterized protein n=1 Tax=Micrococcoides hystricis TaxID=1572761 RepID=A0ABV6PCL6_9MICC